MVFSFSNDSSPPMTINDSHISIVKAAKFLGLNIDDRLNFATHVNALVLKLSKTNGILYKLRDYVPRKVLLDLYYALFYPHLLYCNILWGGTCPTHLNKVEIMQKKCIRIIGGAPFNSHTAPLFNSLGLLNLYDIHKFIVNQHMFKEINKGNFSTSTHPYSTRQSNLIESSFQRLSTTQKSIYYEGPKIWNSLPSSMKNIQDFNLFKKKLKNYYVSQYSLTGHYPPEHG